MFSLDNSADNPSETPLSHLESTTNLTKTDVVEGLGLRIRVNVFSYNNVFKTFCFRNSCEKVLFRSCSMVEETRPTLDRLSVSVFVNFNTTYDDDQATFSYP